MWIDLDDTEIALLSQDTVPASVLKKLQAPAHRDAALFREFADSRSDYLHVHQDAPVERTRNGAYVLSWLWVYNEQVGLPKLATYDDYDLSLECLELLEQTEDFDIADLDAGAEHHLGSEHFKGQQWSLLHNSGLLTLILLPSEGCPPWVYSETPMIAGGTTADGLTDERCMRFLLEAINTFKTHGAFPSEEQQLTLL
ncbi:hypothetical protein [Rhizobium glycinendophyticum]|uniref:Uncharacterized protein n=1 Tax=Rhizobium glycinendophyticum TaxID=2589807 RepID=A0A504TS51_9HYPH|nr:hypothetical protein [Rhizobium glycinendophyticum]TPP04220.1 hypothetical protein FJQ55_22430 [Rhizobium glycinendophyticum]